MRSVLSYIIIASLALPSAAHALERACCHEGDNPRWYAGLSTSLVLLRPADIETTGPLVPTKLSFEPGFGVAGAIGYKLLAGVRTELEVAYRRNELDNIDPPAGFRHLQDSVTIMGNVYIDLINDTPFTPYIGAGIGAIHVKSPVYYTIPGPPSETLSLKEWTLGYQGMLGISYALDAGRTPIVFSFGYRYVGSQEPEAEADTIAAGFKTSNDSHNFELGGRMYF